MPDLINKTQRTIIVSVLINSGTNNCGTSCPSVEAYAALLTHESRTMIASSVLDNYVRVPQDYASLGVDEALFAMLRHLHGRAK